MVRCAHVFILGNTANFGIAALRVWVMLNEFPRLFQLEQHIQFFTKGQSIPAHSNFLLKLFQVSCVVLFCCMHIIKFVAMKPIVEGIGLDWKSQYAKITQNKDKFNYGDIAIVAADGKNRQMLCMPITKLNGWLFSINLSPPHPNR